MFYIKDYAKRKVLASKAVLGMVGQVVENVLCTILETVVIGSIGFVAKEVVSPWEVTDVLLVDVGFNVAYILFGMVHVRRAFHSVFKKPCQLIARKVLGLDLRDTWAFLKLKYSAMIIGMGAVCVAVHSIHDVPYFVRLLCMETLLIQISVDAWNLHGDDIQVYVATAMEPRPYVQVFDPNPETKIETQLETKSETQLNDQHSSKHARIVCNAILREDHMMLK